MCANRTHAGAPPPTVVDVPEFAAPDLSVPDFLLPGPVGHPAAPEVPEPGTAMLTGELVPGAPVLAGPTVDSDLDGTADTTVAEVSDELVLATDLDHDGRADAVTRIGPDAVLSAHADDPAPPTEHPWDAPPPPAPSVDPHTGEWIRG
jgi:hypothetical protein